MGKNEIFKTRREIIKGQEQVFTTIGGVGQGLGEKRHLGENGPGRGSPRERGAQAEKWGERKGGRQVAVTGPGLCTGASLLEMPPVPFDPLSPYRGLQVHFLGDGHWFCQENTSLSPVLTARGPWLVLVCIMSRVFPSVNTGGGARVRLALRPEHGLGTGDRGRGWVCVTWEATVLGDALPCDRVFCRSWKQPVFPKQTCP